MAVKSISCGWVSSIEMRGRLDCMIGEEGAKVRFRSISGRMVVLREAVRVLSVSSRHWQRVMSREQRLQEEVVMVVTCSMHAHLPDDEHVPQPNG